MPGQALGRVFLAGDVGIGLKADGIIYALALCLQVGDSLLMLGPYVAYSCAVHYGLYRYLWRITAGITIVLRYEDGSVLEGGMKCDSEAAGVAISGFISRREDGTH